MSLFAALITANAHLSSMTEEARRTVSRTHASCAQHTVYTDQEDSARQTPCLQVSLYHKIHIRDLLQCNFIQHTLITTKNCIQDDGATITMD